MDDTRAVLQRWNAAPVAAVVPWVLGAAAISLALLISVLAVAHVATPDATGYLLPGLNGPADATFSLGTQAYVLGSGAATISQQFEIGRGALMLTLLPHALPELVALFLPLAAWMIASRRGAWNELLAATAATTLMAIPVLVVAANVEVFVWPRLLRLASPVA